jgi:hypothetical protein
LARAADLDRVYGEKLSPKPSYQQDHGLCSKQLQGPSCWSGRWTCNTVWPASKKAESMKPWELDNIHLPTG